MNTDRATVDRIRDAASMLEAVSAYTLVKTSGSRHSALCPLPGHKEKTPSFTLDDHLGLFHCFGCGRGGDIFKFYMLMENFTFGEALEFLARKHGIPLVRKAPKPGEISKVTLEEILTAVSNLYRKCLMKDPNPGAEYLTRRKLDRAQWEAWELGWAPEGYDTLKRALGAKFSPGDLVQAGVQIQGQQGAYDRFRGRLMFPIRDALGHLVGMAGRTLGDETPKYVNTPETVAFKKGTLLYGLDRARKEAGAKGNLIVVEGYFDCIRLHAAGFNTAVATMGTALSGSHGKLVKKAVPRLVLCFDGDDAGQKAASSAAKTLLPFGLDVDLIFLPKGEDPDSLIASGGPEAFEKLYNERLGFFEFFFKREFPTDPRRLSPAEKSGKVKTIMEFLNCVPDPVLQYAYTSRLAEWTGVAERTLQKVLKSPPPQEDRDPKAEILIAEKIFLGCFLRDKAVFAAFRDRFHVGLFEHPVLKELAARFLEGGLDKWGNYTHIIGEDNDASGLLSELLLGSAEGLDMETHWRRLQLPYLKKELQLLQREFASARPEDIKSILEQKDGINRQIESLRRLSKS
jgi:DNA primase